MDQVTVREALALPDGELAQLFFDWFCASKELPKRAVKLRAKLRELAASPKIDPNWRAQFKNNCPLHGTLYDDLRLSDRNGIVFVVVPASGHFSEKGEAQLWSKQNQFKTPIVRGPWSEVSNWFYIG